MIREERIKQEAKKYRKYRELCGVIDPVALDEIEDAYYDGCLLAKAVVERACRWLKDNIDHYAYNKDFVPIEDFIKSFQKAMESRYCSGNCGKK